MTGRIIVIGAGIGGLTAAALLARRGFDVTVLEAHVYPGGCAGTFFHDGYRFDAGATLAAGFEHGGGMTRLAADLGIEWPVEPAPVAMRIHLPGGQTVTRWADPVRWQRERLDVFGPEAEPFWRWQEQTATALWDLALRGVPWPPQSGRDAASLAGAGARMAAHAPLRLPQLGLDALRPVAAHLASAAPALRHYIDGQLLIAAQATSGAANALYGAAALDMPRRGVAHVRGGIGQIAAHLVDAVRSHGGLVHYRQRVTSVEPRNGGFAIRSHRKAEFFADEVLFNLPPWDAGRLMAGEAPRPLRTARRPADGWGAFIVYVGFDGVVVPPAASLHHQVLLRTPLGEGNSVFLSLSLPDDLTRAPAGYRALTISTHTDLRSWWELFERDRPGYDARKAEYADRVVAAAEVALPGLRSAAKLILPGTPVTFQRYTGRSLGWVGGFPQTSLFQARGPRVAQSVWLVGDSIFPGQSVLATALGGTRVAAAVEAALTSERSSRFAALRGVGISRSIAGDTT